MAKKGGLGRGLDALFSDNSVESLGGSQSVTLPLREIEPNREQPRKTFDEKALNELADSIRQNGVLQPLLVRPMQDGSYQLVAGERRWRASRIAGLHEVPVIIREMSDEQAMEIALIENLQREDLNPIEEAEGLSLLMERYHLTQEQAAERVGMSRPAVANSIRLLNLPEEVRDLTRSGKLSAGHARALLAMGNDADMKAAADEILKKQLSVRDIEKMVKASAAKKPGSGARKKTRDTFFDEAELALSDALGRKVKVLGGNRGGTLVIEFFDKEDLGKLANQLDKS